MGKKEKKKSIEQIEKELLFKPKMRVSLLDHSLVKVADRLVTMDIELATGPKEKHQGPIMVELTLRDQDDVTAFKSYLDRLVGDLPLAEKKVYKSGKKAATLLDEEPLKEFLKHIKAKISNLDDLVKFLREKDFIFVTREWLGDFDIPIQLDKRDVDKQFMIRRIKQAKDPKNDKHDPQLVFALQFAPNKKSGVRVYLYNEPLERLSWEWLAKSDLNFKKMKLTKFPPYMTRDEREKYRSEENKYKLNPEMEKSKFWNRWNEPVMSFNK
jgi:hypothetical protein